MSPRDVSFHKSKREARHHVVMSTNLECAPSLAPARGLWRSRNCGLAAPLGLGICRHVGTGTVGLYTRAAGSCWGSRSLCLKRSVSGQCNTMCKAPTFGNWKEREGGGRLCVFDEQHKCSTETLLCVVKQACLPLALACTVQGVRALVAALKVDKRQKKTKPTKQRIMYELCMSPANRNEKNFNNSNNYLNNNNNNLNNNNYLNNNNTPAVQEPQ